MKTLEKLLPFAAFLTVLLGTFCAAAEAGKRDSELWIEKSEDRIISRGNRLIVPEKYFVYGLNRKLLKSIFANSPLEFTEEAQNRENIIELPTPDGRLERFRILESPVLSPAIAAQFPDWKTFQAYGIDDPTATARLGITLLGFHATVFSTRGTYQIDPYQRNDIDNYITYFKRDVPRTTDFHCLFDEQLIKDDYPATFSFLPKPQFRPGPNRKEYRLAIKGTIEYTAVFGGQTGGFAAVTTTVNRLNGIFRRDLAVGLQLVSGPNFLCSASGTCPYTNEINTAQLNLNQTEIDMALGAANYDVGHLFTTSNGGLAQLASICGGGVKARGASGQPNPQADPFDVDRVAHEIGHQIGANHTFNADANCGSGSLAARKEPGSGVTIMGNAGNCSSTANLQRNSIDNFLVQSQDEVFAFLFGGGATCGTLSGNNIEPIVSAPTSFSIPFNTPYALTATASDGNGDPLTYSWEHDTASGGLTSNYPGTTDDDDTNLGTSRILMRSYPPSNSPTRTFPSLTYILNNANEPPVTYTGTSATGSICATGATCATGEDLPSVARTISYRISVRDGVGGNAVASTNVTFINTTTPFAITSQNTPMTYAGNSTQTVTWNVSGTTAAPIGTANVKISLSTDGGQTFPTTLHASTPNDGTEAILLPNLGTITGRIKVEAVGNIFFDINNAPVIIAAVIRAPFDFDGDGKTDIGIFRPAPAEWWINRSSNGSTLATQFGNTSDKIVPADFTGDGKADIAFWRPATGFWFVLRSEDFSFFSFPFGTNGDVPAPADYDGDSKTDAAVFRPSTVTWYISRSSGGTTIQQFGAGGDLPVVADYDGDGKADIAIFRPNGAEWWIQRSSNNQVFAVQFGAATDKTVQGDYTGDGKADIAFWRPATGFWFILRSEDFSFFSFPFGVTGDVPAPGDYDGDGKFDAAVFRPSETNWFIQRSTAGILIQQFGITGDQPIPNAFVR
jgi:hypothetical protein